MEVSDLITIDPEILGGTPVFKGTRVPIKTLFDYLENNYSLEEFIECFPSVTREMARRVLERSEADRLHPRENPPGRMRSMAHAKFARRSRVYRCPETRLEG